MIQKAKRKRLHNKLWKLFSIFIRKRDRHCVTCGIVKPIDELQAGHYHDKAVSNPDLYFSEKNVSAQCPRCNLFLSGNKTAYAYYLTKKYGIGILEELMTLKNKAVKWTLEDYENRIKHYKQM